MEQLVVWLQRQIDVLLASRRRTSEQRSERWVFWILATLPLVLMIEAKNLVRALNGSQWANSEQGWQRGCFWILLAWVALVFAAVLYLFVFVF
jgi:hypothetical protein